MTYFFIECPQCACTWEMRSQTTIQEFAFPEEWPAIVSMADCKCQCHGFPGVVPRMKITQFHNEASLKDHVRKYAN